MLGGRKDIPLLSSERVSLHEAEKGGTVTGHQPPRLDGLHIAMLTRAVPQHHIGGMELHAETLRRGLVAAGHRVTTITTTLSSGPQTVEDAWGKTYFTDGGQPAAYSSAWNRASVSTLLDIHNQDRFDVIASHGKAAYPYLKSRGRLPGAQRVPVIVISHGNIIDDFRSHAPQRHRRPIRVLANCLPRAIAY